MKNLFLGLLLLVALSVNAQQGVQTFAADTINGDTLVTTSTVNVPYNGFVTFDFDVKGKAQNDTVLIDFQGSNDNWTSFKTISTTTHIQGASAVYTKYQLSASPATYMRYRLYKRAYEVADTAYFRYKIFIYKR
jgi:hypothetical protein